MDIMIQSSNRMIKLKLQFHITSSQNWEYFPAEGRNNQVLVQSKRSFLHELSGFDIKQNSMAEAI